MEIKNHDYSIFNFQQWAQRFRVGRGPEDKTRAIPPLISDATKKTRGVSHMTLPFTFKSILMQKKNYGNSNISPCNNIIFKTSSERNQNPSRYYNSITNLKFQHKPKYRLSKILI
jgi:hypothetical protein